MLDQRLGQLPHVELGVERPADAFRDHHGLLQQQELRLGLHREGLGDLEQLAQQAADRDLGHGSVADRLGDRAAGLHEGGPVLIGGHIAGGEMHIRDALIVGGQEAQQHLAQIAPGRRIEPAHDAEIDRHQIAGLVDEHVAGMHVGVEEAIPEYLLEEDLGGLRQNLVWLHAGFDQGVPFIGGDPADPL